MIEHINNRLMDWIHWRAAVLQRAYGYRSPLADIRDARGFIISTQRGQGSRTGYATTGLAIDHIELEQGVRALPPDLQRVVLLVYGGVTTFAELDATLRDEARRQVARRSTERTCQLCGCAKSTLFARLHSAHVRLMDHLNDCEANRRGRPTKGLTAGRKAGQNPVHSAKVAKIVTSES
jgi:hypothetical protein